MIIETPQAIIELIEIQKASLEANPQMEMDLVIKQISIDCLKQLAKFYEPVFPSDETIISPSEISPYFWFQVRISPRLFVQFRTSSLASSLNFN